MTNPKPPLSVPLHAPSEPSVMQRLVMLPSMAIFDAVDPTVMGDRLAQTLGEPMPGVSDPGLARLWRAIDRRDLDEAQEALGAGADPNARDRRHRGKERTALHRLVELPVLTAGDETPLCQMADLLLRAGAEVDAGDAGQLTPAVLAARCERWDLVRTLLAAGANPVQAGTNGETVLGHAIGELQGDLVSTLVEKGLDPNHRWSGQTMLMHMLDNPTLAIEQDLAPRRAFLARLLGLGAAVNAMADDREGETPLLLAMQYHSDLVEDLLDAGADASASRTVSIAHTARHHNLLEDIVWQSHGWTALHLAALANLPQLCERLIAAGADVRARTSDPKTPAEAADHMKTHQSMPETVAPGMGLLPLEVAQHQGSTQAQAVLERHTLRQTLHDERRMPMERPNVAGHRPRL